MLYHFWHTWPNRPDLDDRPADFNRAALINPKDRVKE
jgi:hypothetical protein